MPDSAPRTGGAGVRIRFPGPSVREKPCGAPVDPPAVCRWNFPPPPAKAYSVTVAAYAFRWRVEPSTWKGLNALDTTAMREKTFRWAKMHPA